MEEKKVKVNEATNEVIVPIDLTKLEYDKLKQKLELFNKDVPEESKLTFEEYLALIFETSILEDKLETKLTFVELLKMEVKQLEEELLNKYSVGLEPSEEVYNEVIELRRQTLKDSSAYAKSYKSDYIDLLVNFISSTVYASSYEDRILTLKEDFEEDLEKNPSDVLKAVQIVKHDVKPSSYEEEVKQQLDYFEKYITDNYF